MIQYYWEMKTKKVWLNLANYIYFDPVLLGHENEKSLAEFGQLNIFRRSIIATWNREKLAKLGQLHLFVPLLLGHENLSENLHTLIIIIIIIIRYGCLLSQACSSRYFSWTSGDPHRSGFKLHTAVLSVLCVMFQV